LNNFHKMPRWRLIILFILGLFCLSVSMPVIASLSPHRIEPGQVTPMGIFDVALAFTLAIIGMMIYAKGKNLISDATYRVSHNILTAALATILLATTLIFDRVVWWDVLAIGLAWRIYLFVLVLPAAMAIWNHKEEGAQ